MDNEQLKQWMETNQIGNNELARILDVDPGLVSKYANGDRPVSSAFKWRFLQRFGVVSTAAVFGEIRKPQPVQ